MLLGLFSNSKMPAELYPLYGGTVVQRAKLLFHGYFWCLSRDTACAGLRILQSRVNIRWYYDIYWKTSSFTSRYWLISSRRKFMSVALIIMHCQPPAHLRILSMPQSARHTSKWRYDFSFCTFCCEVLQCPATATNMRAQARACVRARTRHATFDAHDISHLVEKPPRLIHRTL